MKRNTIKEGGQGCSGQSGSSCVTATKVANLRRVVTMSKENVGIATFNTHTEAESAVKETEGAFAMKT